MGSSLRISFSLYNKIIIVAGSFSDDEQGGDNEPLPDFLLPNYSHNINRSPHLNRASDSPPKIIKASLKNFSGLEGTHLPSQDSVDFGGGAMVPAGGKVSRPADPDQVSASPQEGDQELTSSDPASTVKTPSPSSIVSISQESNRVKIQVPGLPVSKTSKSSLVEQ